jgi:hypothetical protein
MLAFPFCGVRLVEIRHAFFLCCQMSVQSLATTAHHHHPPPLPLLHHTLPQPVPLQPLPLPPPPLTINANAHHHHQHVPLQPPPPPTTTTTTAHYQCQRTSPPPPPPPPPPLPPPSSSSSSSSVRPQVVQHIETDETRPTRENLRACCREAFRVLKPGGTFIISTRSKEPAYDHLYWCVDIVCVVRVVVVVVVCVWEGGGLRVRACGWSS